ncbi:MAG: hypothetical protein A2Z27_04110 [candidate division Zixibacteria bacterium RBG_16_50_21]|nr:MAG: hypothetical protein A2Z27_04110 [candidate division Zixibacteria bacterium RBG_16_50_21]
MKRPFVTLKFARTLDGYIATKTGDSRWISGPESRRYAHKLRSRHDAVLVGVNTVLKDDPRLDVRLVKGKNPLKVIVDSKLRTPLTARVIRIRPKLTILAMTKKASLKKVRQFEKLGIQVLVVPADRSGKVDLKRLFPKLREIGIKKLMVEGGSRILTSFVNQGLADRVVIFISPKILGTGIESLNRTKWKSATARKITQPEVFRLGEDLVLEGKPLD